MVTTDGQRDEMLSLDSSTQNAKGSFFLNFVIYRFINWYIGAYKYITMCNICVI